MPLTPNSRLGPFAILAAIGAGGMGEVYRARDSNLRRDVALKVLPEAFASDAERMARLLREAQVLASLNHPNIASIYGVEQGALVMELVEGPTLAERIAAGSIPADEALEIADQIAAALEYAHDQGVIHRDLKPANVKIAPGGVVKLLDFGLAKAVAGEQTSHDPAQSPTLTMNATRMGIILGTAAYMSPEQAKGRPVDRRTDIWAFGVVLYEMLTGHTPFRGESIPEILAALLKEEPEWGRIPARVRRLLQCCLQKDFKLRLRDIADAKLLLDRDPVPDARRKRGVTSWIPWAAALVLAVVAAWGWLHAPAPRGLPVSHWTIQLAATDPGNGFGVAVSRDGTHLAYAVRAGGSSQIVVRTLDQAEAKALPGTEGGVRPFFSSDGQWLAYATGVSGPFRKVAVTGGPSFTLCEDGSYFGGSWGEDGQIVFVGGGGSTLMRVAESGGKCEVVSRPDPQKGEIARRFPQILPGGRSVLFTIGSSGSYDNAKLAVLDVASGATRILVENACLGRYVPTGHLVYVRGGTMFAVPFDLKKLAVTGPETTVIESVYYNTSGGFADYAFSDAGLLLYMLDTRQTNLFSLDWIDRKGAVQPTSVPPQKGPTRISPHSGNLRLSPDGQRAALNLIGEKGNDIWIADLTRGTLSRLTSGGVHDQPVWTPDGKRIAFYSSGEKGRGILWAAADGSGKPEFLVSSPGTYALPDSWTPDTRTLLYESIAPRPARVWALDLAANGGEAKRRELFESSQFNQTEARLSPDGKWVAYVSDDSGKNQIYVRPYPDLGGRTLVSVEGGENPHWSHDGREIFFRDAVKDMIMAADVQAGASFRSGLPHPLFGHRSPDWDVAADGRRFLVRRIPQTEQNEAKMQAVVNWFADLQRKAPERR